MESISEMVLNNEGAGNVESKRVLTPFDIDIA